MKAVIIEKFGGNEEVKIAEMPMPKPADGEVQIEVKYAAVNPVDWKIRDGLLERRVEHQFPIILGWDASGLISEIGKNVKTFKVGDEVFVYCRKPIIQWGTYAEYVCIDAQHVALKPTNISFAEAAAIPLTGLTAWQALFENAQLRSGETILIHAGAGGVGGMAIQFAKSCGANVISTASSQNHDYVIKLGADYVIDYVKEDFSQKIKERYPQGIDVVFDTVGGKTHKSSYEIIKKGGRLVTIVEPIDDALANKYQVRGGYVFVIPNGIQLKKIGDLIVQGKVAPPEIEVMKLEDAKAALEKSNSRRTRGKIVLEVD